MPKVIRTEAAEQDLRDIAYYIAVEDGRPLVADKLIDEITAKCDSYAQTPGIIGTDAPHLGEGYRTFPHKRWVIIFRYIQDGIEVLRIVDASRDYPNLFR